MLDLLDEIDGRLTGVTIRWPEAWGLVWSIQKHVRFALYNDKQVDMKESLDKTRGRMSALIVNHPEFHEYLFPLVEKINKEIGVTGTAARRTSRRVGPQEANPQA